MNELDVKAMRKGNSSVSLWVWSIQLLKFKMSDVLHDLKKSHHDKGDSLHLIYRVVNVIRFNCEGTNVHIRSFSVNHRRIEIELGE